jgi:hypothetical protein
VRTGGDEGKPIVVAEPLSAPAAALGRIALAVAAGTAEPTGAAAPTA